jgi:hypothetical protein
MRGLFLQPQRRPTEAPRPAPDAVFAVEPFRGRGRLERRVSLDLHPTFRSRISGANARKASFTAALSGNTSITSGSTTTTFAPCAYRAAVSPRTAPEKSYSGRMVSRSSNRSIGLLAFFILSPFRTPRRPRTDKPRPRWALCVRYDQEPTPRRHTEQHEPLLADGMIRVRHQQRERIAKDRRASSNDTPCLRRFDAAFAGSHSNS